MKGDQMALEMQKGQWQGDVDRGEKINIHNVEERNKKMDSMNKGDSKYIS